jgi:putative membrane protein
MRFSFPIALSAASILVAPAFAQSPPPVLPPAPAPTVTAPSVAPGAPVSPLSDSDARFVQTQTENNMAEYQAAQLALQRSQNQNVRNFAEKMITDHTYMQGTLNPIAQMHPRVPLPQTLTEQDREMLAQLAGLSGPAFDRAYMNSMVQANSRMIGELNSQITYGWDQHISAWVQNTRPILLQHSDVAQQVLSSLPPTG